jgi:hypothetical protein
MKAAHLLPTLLLFWAALAAGCSTFQGRATEKAAVFGALDPATQARLKDGRLQPGDTVDMAYIALGEPDEKRDQLTAEGSAVVWIYHTYWRDYQGEEVVGYQPVRPGSPKAGPPLYAPVTHSVYQDREEEYLRVTFKDGKVTVIERPKA